MRTKEFDFFNAFIYIATVSSKEEKVIFFPIKEPWLDSWSIYNHVKKTANQKKVKYPSPPQYSRVFTRDVPARPGDGRGAGDGAVARHQRVVLDAAHGVRRVKVVVVHTADHRHCAVWNKTEGALAKSMGRRSAFITGL